MPFDPDIRLAEWRKSLLDITKRNRLIKFVTGRIGGVNLLHPSVADFWDALVRDGKTVTFARKHEILGLPPDRLDVESLAADFDPNREVAAPRPADIDDDITKMCLRSPQLHKDHLLTDFSDRQLTARLTRLYRNAKEAVTDHGVTTLFVAIGFLRWYESQDSDEEVLSPLLLIPVNLDRETVESPFTLTAEEDEVLPNHCLVELLQTQFRITLPIATDCPLDPENNECLANYFKAVFERVKHVPRWSVVETAAIGVFNFQKLAMWEDLGKNAERVMSNPLCRAIGGDSAVSLKPPCELPVATDLDRLVPSRSAMHILDADSSQHEAIEAVKLGANLVIDGPPGTGKSQTIANMIAELLAGGKTVLFVSEKTAALDVVKRRLDRCGLGDFCLELHSAKSNKKSVLAELGRCLELAPIGVVDTKAQLQELDETRKRLNEFVIELHAIRQPLGWSVYRVHGELARFNRTLGRSRAAIPDVLSKDAEYLRRGTEIFTMLADARSVLEEKGGHPWRGCKITTYSHGAADEAKFELTQLAKTIPEVERVTQRFVQSGVGENPYTVRSWRVAEVDADRILKLPMFPKDWFQSNPSVTAEAVIEIDTSTRVARELAEKLPEFDHVAVRKVTNPNDVKWIADRERLTTPLPVRERVTALNRVAGALGTLQKQVNQIEGILREITSILRLPMLGFHQTSELSSLASRLAASPPVPSSWWNPARRDEVLAVVSRSSEDARVAQSERMQLVVRLSLTAFGHDRSSLVSEAATAAASSWRWLPWSTWGKLRSQLEQWYAPPLPPDPVIRADIATLAKYHHRMEAMRQVGSEYAAELFHEPTGLPSWDATIQGLRDVITLEQWNAAPDLKTILGPGGSLDRTILAKQAKQLFAATEEFNATWASLLLEYSVPDPSVRLKHAPSELTAWLDADARFVEMQAVALGRVVELLRADRDILAANLREQAERLHQLIVARTRIAAAAEKVGDTRAADLVETTDHASSASTARSLLEFLSSWDRLISEPLRATLTEATSREELRAALNESNAIRSEFDRLWTRIQSGLFEVNVQVSSSLVLEQTPLAELLAWTIARTSDTGRLLEWAQFVQVEKAVEEFGITAILDEVKSGEFSASDASGVFRTRFFRLWIDATQQLVPALGSFTTEMHERLIDRFAALDEFGIRTTPFRVREHLNTNWAHPKDLDLAPETSELGLLLREVNKKRRHLPLRELLRRAPTIISRIKPCLMMSPLAVSTYLDAPELKFDVVIFDEASQVRPHDAICAIYRGKQLVVGGDPKQLPPTDFFHRTGDDAEDSDDASAGFESLLDICVALGLTRKRLRWHYRSRREGLIAFSNKYIYEGRLVTFPSADEASGRAVTFEKVPGGRFKDGINPVEAKYVAVRVLEHARTNSDRSLGVIAFSQRQQDRILDELEFLRRQSPETEPFFATDRQDPFFVKNLENVQGDERDVILLSVGYGPDDTGKVAMRFGPLNRNGGERRLNVAITRARWAMVVVSSMTAGDVDLSRTGAEGARMLKAFLDYAEQGPAALSEELTGADRRSADSPFEQEVGEELIRRGLVIQRRVGCGGYLLDLAVVDPQQGGRYLLGIECDGATYYSAATARDRDRLRKLVLEGLGWRLVRVWSSDWVRDREKQVRRILHALETSGSESRREPLPMPEILYTRPVSRSATEFDSIDAVPDSAMGDTLTRVLHEFGSMPADDLIAAVSKRFGFKRTGPKIRERIAESVNVHLSSNKLYLDEEGRVRLKTP